MIDTKIPPEEFFSQAQDTPLITIDGRTLDRWFSPAEVREKKARPTPLTPAEIFAGKDGFQVIERPTRVRKCTDVRHGIAFHHYDVVEAVRKGGADLREVRSAQIRAALAEIEAKPVCESLRVNVWAADIPLLQAELTRRAQTRRSKHSARKMRALRRELKHVGERAIIFSGLKPLVAQQPTATYEQQVAAAAAAVTAWVDGESISI